MSHKANSKTSQDAATQFHDDCNACKEYRELSRRRFMKHSSLAAAGIMTAPSWLPRVVLGNGNKRGGATPDILVSVFWRGGPDLLSQAIPYSDPWLYAAPYNSGSEFFPDGLRPTIGILPPDKNDPDPDGLRCLDLEDKGNVGPHAFGLNKAYGDPEFNGETFYNHIFEFFQAGEVAFIPAAGSPDTNRSHFSAEAKIEYGNPNQQIDELTGWMARYLSLVPTLGSPLRAAALPTNTLVPKMLAFAEKTLAFQTVDSVVLPGNVNTAAEREKILSARYAEQTEEPLQGTVLNAFQIINLLEQVENSPHKDAHYTNSSFGQRMLNAAKLIKGEVPVEIIYVDRTGWDNHSSLGPHRGGGMYDRLKDISQNLAAFRIDCQDFWHRITLVGQGEFGRQINENADFGTDHGNGGLMMVWGGNVNGRFYGKESLGGADGWPGLDPALTIDDDAIRTTVDYRAIYREVLTKRMHVDPTLVDSYIFKTDDEQPPPVLDELGLVNENR